MLDTCQHKYVLLSLLKFIGRDLSIMHLSMLSPRQGTPGICGAFDFSEEFLVKIPTTEPQNLVKSDQISPPWGSNIP